MRYDFDWVTDEMTERVADAEDRGEALDAECGVCPYYGHCAECGACYACPLWEAYMGEDL